MSTWKVVKTKKKKEKMVVKFKVGFGFENCNSFSNPFFKEKFDVNVCRSVGHLSSSSTALSSV